jgi:hypothetical protein
MGNNIQKEVVIIASGDLRLSANQDCWAAQEQMEKLLSNAIQNQGWSVKRAHEYDSEKKHGLIDSQKMGMEVFAGIDTRRLWLQKAYGNTAITCWPV